MSETKTAVCDRCGEDTNSYQVRDFGPRDRETGYQDQELVCSACLGDPGDEDDDQDEGYYAAMDQRFTEMYENGEI